MFRGSKKRVVYTAVFGNYDKINPAPQSSEIDFVYFSDEDQNVIGWEYIKYEDKYLGNSSNNRYIKFMPHMFFDQYEESLYIDANIVINKDPTPLFVKYLSHSNIAVPRHSQRTDVRHELNACFLGGLINEEQFKYYEDILDKLWPENSWFLSENGVIFRRHKESVVKKIMEDTWKEYSNFNSRDQIVFPIICWRNKFLPLLIDEGPRLRSKIFSSKPHNNARSNYLKYIIQYILINRNKKSLFLYISIIIDLTQLFFNRYKK
jgi:hypothetical protein